MIFDCWTDYVRLARAAFSPFTDDEADLALVGKRVGMMASTTILKI